MTTTEKAFWEVITIVIVIAAAQFLTGSEGLVAVLTGAFAVAYLGEAIGVMREIKNGVER